MIDNSQLSLVCLKIKSITLLSTNHVTLYTEGYIVLPKPVPPLTGEAARKFEEQDERPMSSDEKAFLKECLEIYKRNPIKE